MDWQGLILPSAPFWFLCSSERQRSLLLLLPAGINVCSCSPKVLLLKSTPGLPDGNFLKKLKNDYFNYKKYIKGEGIEAMLNQ